MCWSMATFKGKNDFDRTKLSRPRLTICLIQINPSWFGYSPIDIYSRVIQTGDPGGATAIYGLYRYVPL